MSEFIFSILCLLIGILCLSNLSVSKAEVAPKPWKGITVRPHESLNLVVPRYLHEEDMILSCDMENPTYKNGDHTVIKVAGFKYILQQRLTHITFKHQHKYYEPDQLHITINNMDDTDTVNFVNCNSSYY